MKTLWRVMPLIGMTTHKRQSYFPKLLSFGAKGRKHHLSASQAAWQPSYWEMKILKIYSDCRGQRKAIVLTGAGREKEQPSGKINQPAVIRSVVSGLGFASFAAFSMAFQPKKKP